VGAETFYLLPGTRRLPFRLVRRPPSTQLCTTWPLRRQAGGHLVLWDLQLIIEFPPGATILIPSALLRHSNTTIQKGEERYSFTQYTAGGPFRWVDHGFQKEAEYYASLSEEGVIEEGEAMQRRWATGLGLLTSWFSVVLIGHRHHRQGPFRFTLAIDGGGCPLSFVLDHHRPP
jgi:hypothetical protein